MPYTTEEIRRIMDETDQLLAENARLGRRQVQTGAAKAAATSQPPTANDRFFAAILKLMEEEKLSKSQATRRVAIERPVLTRSFIVEANKKRKIEEQRKKETAARIRNRNN